ncbi:MAG: CDP-diacylglycerol--serine O-phosphatidyltransferase [Nitrospinae bacterium]|jgi:CDP-diacylglycerol---serine O-phosphatidyltransferase|nr:CDP-diacylglycerol--serine O-phosphatidyltransferase [Nitrospinota bacterium]MDA1108550.1 CDP-diacylglycerol--serine O-phosphatidyltransferase [Nitrospinota bacterium]
MKPYSKPNQKMQVKLKKGIHILPSLFTTGNVFCGFYAFIAVFKEMYYVAAWAIVLAIVFDILDGRIARMTKTTSAFGVQYDSLADIISFGMAPAFLVYSWVLQPFDRVGWMAAFLFLLCAALRLARFNVTKPDVKGKHFLGLPTPAAAAILASIVIGFEDLFATRLNPIVMVIVVYLLAFLMVSNIKYPAMKKLEFKKRVAFPRFLFVILFIYVLATIPRIALFVLSFTYVMMGPLSYLIPKKTIDVTDVSENIHPPPTNS